MKSAIRSKRCVKIIRSPQRFVHITDIISFNRARKKHLPFHIMPAVSAVSQVALRRWRIIASEWHYLQTIQTSFYWSQFFLIDLHSWIWRKKIISCTCEMNEFWKACMQLLHGQGVSSALLVSHINLHLHTLVLSLKSIFKLISERVLNTHRGQLNKNASLSNRLYYKNDCKKEGNYQWSLCFTALICYKEILFPLWLWNIFTYIGTILSSQFSGWQFLIEWPD